MTLGNKILTYSGQNNIMWNDLIFLQDVIILKLGKEKNNCYPPLMIEFKCLGLLFKIW